MAVPFGAEFNPFSQLVSGLYGGSLYAEAVGASGIMGVALLTNGFIWSQNTWNACVGLNGATWSACAGNTITTGWTLI